MVGYVLGLGDRHPCNIMLDQLTGKLIHIDFGDCFEVAMHREKFPETIPFRLTRMLVSAMEVSGIEGNFRTTCVSVMRVLRENKESVMAVLEAFIHDPLINWRLMKPPEEEEQRVAPEEMGMETAVIRRSVVKQTISDENLLEAGTSDIMLNARALEVTDRVRNKLTGKDFDGEVLGVSSQVHRLILEATSYENLCQCYIGWCPYW